jgi:opacity protein-like surface antigen
MKRLLAAFVVMALAAATAAAPDVTGNWNVAVDGPHGSATMSLVLKQDGRKVTGTFVSGHGPDLALEGEFVDGALKIESADGDDHKVIFSAKLKEDGTLAGYVSGPMGDMKWTASRVKDRK